MESGLHRSSMTRAQSPANEGQAQMSGRVLIVEDEREIADLLVAYVERGDLMWHARPACPMQCARTHNSAGPRVPRHRPAGGDGIDVLTAIRRRFDTPVIMVTALDDDVTKLSSLRMGADDYVVKPFNPSEVVERVRAVLRRVQGQTGRRMLNVGELIIDLDARVVTCRADDGSEGERLQLTPTEFQILAHMARQPRRAFTRASCWKRLRRERGV